MALADQALLAENIDFQKAVRQVVVAAAREYIDAGQEGSAKFARYLLAQQVLADGGIAKLNAFVYAYASKNTLTAANYEVNITGHTPAVWNNLCGLSAGAA